MKFDLRKVKNGLIIKSWYDSEETEGPEELVHQERYEDDDEVEAFADFLSTINDHYGPSTSRYSPKRIYIRVAPGDKHEDFKGLD